MSGNAGHIVRTRDELFDDKWIPEPMSGCFLWTAYLLDGYGKFHVGQRCVKAHRWAYERARGPIPPGLDLDHLCRNRACVNPLHLEAVTRRVNLLRGAGFPARQAAQTRCFVGHPFDARNTYYRSPTSRQCRACAAILARARRRARRMVAQ